jgi:hypothetical protein
MPSSRFVRRQEQQLINQSDHERPGLATSLHTAIPFPFLILDIAKPHSNSNLLDIVDILTFTIPTHQHRVEGITGKGNLFAGGSSSSPLLLSSLLCPTRLIFPDSVSTRSRSESTASITSSNTKRARRRIFVSSIGISELGGYRLTTTRTRSLSQSRIQHHAAISELQEESKHVCKPPPRSIK